MAPPSSLVVYRSRPRRKRAKRTSSTSRTSSHSNKAATVRRGFVFPDPSDDESDDDGDNDGDNHNNRNSMTTASKDLPFARSNNSTKSSSRDNTFVFRVTKTPQHTVDVSTASAALQSRKERARKAAERRERRAKQQHDDERQAAYVKQLRNKLTADQMWLFELLSAQIKRETRKTSREFAKSSAQNDILHLTEVSLQALKDEFVAFMIDHPPAETLTNLPNPENARLRALIDTCAKRSSDMDDEEQLWEAAIARIAAEPNDGDEEEEDAAAASAAVALPIADSVDAQLHQAIAQISTTAQKLELIDDSVQSVDRMILQVEMKKAALFQTFHAAAFRGYKHMAQPKEALRALLKFAPSSGSTTATAAAAAPTPMPATSTTDAMRSDDNHDDEDVNMTE